MGLVFQGAVLRMQRFMRKLDLFIMHPLQSGRHWWTGKPCV